MNALTCEVAETLIASSALDSPLNGADAGALHDHLEGCEPCRQVAHDFNAIADGLPLALPLAQPAASLRARIMAAAYADAEAPAVKRTAFRWRWSVPQLRWRSLGYAGAMAAVAVAAFGGARLTNRPVTPPAAQVFSVTGTTSEPSARGSLSYDPATQQTVLTVTGLPQPSALPGQQTPVYEVWLVRSDRSVNGVAFLTHQPSGSWTTAWHDNLHAYVAVAATVEPYGGSAAPTSPQVLQGDVASV